MGPPDGGGVGVHGVRRQVEDVAVAAGGEDDGVREVACRSRPVIRSRATMPRARPSTTIRSSISVRGCISTLPGGDLPGQRLVGAEQQLLARLAAGVEGPGDLDAAEGAGVEQAAVLAGEGHALGHALVDDLDGDLGEPVDVGLAGAEVAALDGVVEQPVDGVAVVAVVLGGVDAALRGDGVGAARGVLVAELDDVVALFGERGAGRAAGEAGADDDDGVLAAVGGVDQLGLEAAACPSARRRGRRAPWCRRPARRSRSRRSQRSCQLTTPVMTATGTATKPTVSTSARTLATVLRARSRRALPTPRVWAALQKPCRMCRPSGEHRDDVDDVAVPGGEGVDDVLVRVARPRSRPGARCRSSGRGCARR